MLEGRILEPMDGYGIKVMSIGFLVEEEPPMIWRGPMVMSAITQMLREVAWGELDVLVVDMPPGTGDAQLTMAQATPLAGAVIVSTPQDLALIDARRGVAMFKRVEIPILGIVENMATFVCPHCGQASHIFGHGGARHEAERLGVPFLGEVPAQHDDPRNLGSGPPGGRDRPRRPERRVYRDIARQVWATPRADVAGAAPRIVIEEGALSPLPAELRARLASGERRARQLSRTPHAAHRNPSSHRRHGQCRGNHAFYTQTLGMRLVKKTVNQDDVSAYHLFYADGRPRPAPTSPSSTGRWGASGAARTASPAPACA